MDDAVIVVQTLTAGTLALFGGVQIVLTGLVAWIGKLWLEREKSKLSADLETVKAALERALHVHRVQFEHEYQVYADLWDKLVSLRSATVQLRPESLDYPPTKAEEQRREEFIEAFNSFNKAVERKRPFYADAVYRAMKELRMIARTEWRQANPDRPITEKVWDEVEVNREKIVESVEETCAAIRDRIAGLMAEA